jgi:quinol monooxygenase YgiN
MVARRPMLAGLGLAMLGGSALAKERAMDAGFGMVGKIKAQPGKRSELIAILGSGTRAMPGCLAYLVAEDSLDEDAIWITEMWDSIASHAASLKLPAVRDAIAKGRPLILGFELNIPVRPVPGASFWNKG